MEKVTSLITNKTSGKPIRCKGAVCRKAGEALVIEEVEVATPRAYEVRIKVLCTSLCHSDVTYWKGLEGPRGVFPRIFGHEAVGMVESVGDYVVEVKEGDVVVPFFHPNCQECWDCKSQESNICTKFPFGGLGMPRDGTSRFTDSKGEVVHNFIKVSSFIEYTVVDICNLVKISPDFPLDKACLLSCGVPTGIGAAWKTAKVEKGSTVAIFGLGAIGLAVAEGARMRGASKIIGIDLNPEKFKIGRKFGVTDFINPKDCGNRAVNEVIKEMTGGGADYCFECVGLASLMNLAFTSCRNGSGKTIVLGIEMNGTPLSLGCYELLRGKTITGSIFGGVKAKTDIPLLAQSYIDKELHLDDFITHEVNFEDINEAFDLLIQGLRAFRCLFCREFSMYRNLYHRMYRGIIQRFPLL